MSRFNRWNWLIILIVGLFLFFAAEQALVSTGNLAYVPAVIVIGAFLVPVVFLVFSYEYEHISVRDLPFSSLAVCFIWGGFLGVVIAGVLEVQVLQGLGVLQLLGVGLIEEGAKLVWPVVVFVRKRYLSEADGLLFGLNAGMGFAALETVGYGLMTLLRSRGSLGALEQTLFVRGLMSPAGHAAWTGLVCAILWRQREKGGRGVLNLAVVGAFVGAVLLHALWDIFNIITTDAFGTISLIASMVIALVSLSLLSWRMRDSRRRHNLDSRSTPAV